MRKRLYFCVLSLIASICGANAADLSCGTGYVLVDSREKIDGIPVAECQKLWCVDLETGRKMGDGAKANSGYIDTSDIVKLCDNDKNCIECWGDRRWCAGEVAGEWNPKYGAYTRRGEDNATYESYQKGNCFVWRLEKPDCAAGEIAILQDDKWVCTTMDIGTGVSRESGIRRTSTSRRIQR
ncbi:MAG: hypothetical protein II219_01975 [Alphaproteobacteria bacterium]|nr:hypothetical protein [Alphaproteobacteria bacterium]